MRIAPMRGEKEEGVAPSCILLHGSWVDIKSLLIAILLVSTLILASEVFFKYSFIGPACSLNQVKDSIHSLKISQGTTLNEGATLADALEWRDNDNPIASDGCNTSKTIENSHNNTTSFGKAEEVINVDNVTVIRRDFKGFGSAASIFVEFGAYRGGDNSFAIVGLGSKPLHVYGDANFQCVWEPADRVVGAVGPRVKGRADKFLPDWGYGRVYTVVVVNCTFEEGVGVDGQGGKLILHATSSHIDMANFVALEETSESYAASSASYKSKNYTYDFLYCGSSLFGDINLQRIREWLAYHVRLMGPKSHFVFHDAGGVSAQVRQVLLKWQALGHVTLHDIREQAKFDGYYYNQFLVVNDCLHRTRFLAKWTFFFDVDEYLYVPPQTTLLQTMQSFSNYSQITIEQSPMSSKLCLPIHNSSTSREMWGFERLIFRNIKRGHRWDRKYAIQARNVLATGVHMSENVVGKTMHTKGSLIKYYHYHNTITSKEAGLCKEIVNSSSISLVTYLDEDPYQIDLGLQYVAQAVKEFELQKIGLQQLFA
ncbi:hypothetical protein GOP47_0011583 [Adiantum capillus-veneris]|uniref:Glycosyltransferase family 92 protein n=1 Tax=Adiantum capillus-veneris TaxID=13818 RepID=A0A9D4ZHT4_ADICA|nr:hypothetical protein GOP47_0011583 [Adiantum capillus-veneris]